MADAKVAPLKLWQAIRIAHRAEASYLQHEEWAKKLYGKKNKVIVNYMWLIWCLIFNIVLNISEMEEVLGHFEGCCPAYKHLYIYLWAA